MERATATARFRLGVDIGGTFTDATLLDEESGKVTVDKVPSTPSDPSIGFLNATLSILAKTRVDPSTVEFVVHATTVATNAIIEGTVAPIAFLTTGGFRDMLELARQMRPTLYDLRFEKPPPLVPRYRCFDVPERLDARGNILVPLDEQAVRLLGERFRQDGLESVALCFLHSYVNPVHERRARDILLQVYPDLAISLSSEVAPEFREYYRASTTVINAAISPIVSRYVENIENKLREEKLNCDLLIMQSSGGVYSARGARERPVYMVESGPAAGVIAATHIGRALGLDNVISFDMGGTTAKVCLVKDGAPRVTKDYEVGGKGAPGTGSSRGSGYPIRTAVIDLVEIGAGGGSIAWVDAGGILRVGPRSAGADPGPVCYGRGGTEPTVTDANLVLGRLNPRYFLGGGLEINVGASRIAIERHCGEKLDLGVVEAAHAIVEIANTAMVNALRLVSVQHGYDPREFILVAFGGAGPVHANRLAVETGIRTILVPLSAGTTSAMGLLVTDLKRDYATTIMRRADAVEVDALIEAYHGLEAQGRGDLLREGVSEEVMSFVRELEMRYIGQSYELSITLDRREEVFSDIPSVVAKFHREHERSYGYSAATEPVEFVNARVTAIGEIVRPRLHEIPKHHGSSSGQSSGSRQVYFAEQGGFGECAIIDRYQLGAGATIIGPAIIEEFDTTTVLHPGNIAEVDRFGNLLISQASDSSGGR